MKKMGRILSICFIVMFSYVVLTQSICRADTQNAIWDMPYSAQEHSNWCWAASIESVLDYFCSNRTDVVSSQCKNANLMWNRTDCCGNATFAWNHPCNSTAPIYGSNKSLQGILQFWGVKSNGMATYLPMGTVISEIDAGRPFVMRWGLTGGSGHFLLGYGYIKGDDGYNSLFYYDPDPSNGPMLMDYNWAVSGTGHTWTHTLQITPPKADSAALYAYFTGAGLYKYDGSAWTYIHAVQPASMIAGTNLYAYYAGYGLYKYDGYAWTYVHPNQPTVMTAGTNLYAYYAGYGLYRYDGTAWSYLNPNNPTGMIAGPNLYAYFTGTGAGLYKYDGSAWTYLHPSNPASMVGEKR